MELFAFGSLREWPRTMQTFIRENGHNVSFWEDVHWEKIVKIQPELACLTVEERVHIPSFEIAKTELIAEHNLIPELHTNTTSLATIEWMRIQYQKHLSEVKPFTVF